MDMKKPILPSLNLTASVLLWAVGTCLFTFQHTIFDRIGFHPGFLGGVLFSGAVINLSAHLSRFVGQPRYDLKQILEDYIRQHKCLAFFTGLGILFLSPYSALLGLGVGLFLDKTQSDLLIKTSLYFNQIKHVLNTYTNERLLNKLGQLIRSNPGRTLSLLIGATTPFAFMALLSDLLGSAFYSGVIEELSILSLAANSDILATSVITIGITATTIVALLAIPLGLAIGGGWLGYTIWEAVRNKSLSFFYQAQDNAQTLLTALKTRWLRGPITQQKSHTTEHPFSQKVTPPLRRPTTFCQTPLDFEPIATRTRSKAKAR